MVTRILTADIITRILTADNEVFQNRQRVEDERHETSTNLMFEYLRQQREERKQDRERYQEEKDHRDMMERERVLDRERERALEREREREDRKEREAAAERQSQRDLVFLATLKKSNKKSRRDRSSS